MARSMNAADSPSWPLTMTYLVFSGAFFVVSHFRPAGKPPPPRPRRFAFLTSSRTSAEPICGRVFGFDFEVADIARPDEYVRPLVAVAVAAGDPEIELGRYTLILDFRG